MGLLSIFKKSKKSTQLARPQSPSFEQVADSVLKTTGKQIQEGLARPTASTGTPVENLHGAAKTITQLSNIGGGSKATGGGGIDKGLKTVTQYTQARTAKKILEQGKQKKIGKK